MLTRTLLVTAALVALVTPSFPQEFLAPLVSPETSYLIDVRLDSDAGYLTGTGSSVVRNVGAHELTAIAFQWSGQESAPFELMLAGAARELAPAADPIEVRLPQPLDPGDELTLSFRFRYKTGDLDRGWGATKWFPRLWWGYPTHASYDVGVQVPSDVVVAASARPDPNTGRYRGDHIRRFGLYFARGFEVAEVNAGPTLVRSIFRADMKECARLVLETAAEAVSFYRERFGMYPQPSLTIIPGGPNPVGGYPYATAIVVVHGQEACSDRPPDTHWRWIAAHEVAHQYWLEHVLEKEPEQGYGWLMIGLGIWSDREWARASNLDSLHTKFLDIYANAVRDDRNTTIEIAPEELRRLDYNYNYVVTHRKGFGIVSGLAAVLGPETFARVCQRALREYAGRRLGSSDFRRIAEEESGQDLGWYFVPFLRTNGFSSYEVDSTAVVHEGSRAILRAQVVSRGDILLPVPVEARFTDGTRERRILDRTRREQALEFPAEAPLAELVIDPDREFPLVIPPPQVTATRFPDLAGALPWKGAGSQALWLYHQADDLEVEDIWAWGRLGLTLFYGRHYQESLRVFERLVPAARGESSSWYFAGLVWCGMLNDLLGHRDVALDHYRQALSVEGNPTMEHSQYGLLLDQEWVRQRLQTAFTWP